MVTIRTWIEMQLEYTGLVIVVLCQMW